MPDMSTVRSVKILTLLQICTIAAVFVLAWLYFNPSHTAACGMVNGILLGTDRSLALIDGQVVKTGETIYGVRIVGIEKGKVYFEKNDREWVQRVHQRPDPAWDEPDKPPEPNETRP